MCSWRLCRQTANNQSHLTSSWHLSGSVLPPEAGFTTAVEQRGAIEGLGHRLVISFPRITIFSSLLTTPPVELFGGVLVPSNIWINCINPSVEEDFFTVQLFQIVCCCYCYRSHRPEDLANCYHYAIMQLLLCVLLFSQWSKYACICHCCMPQTCNARCWPIIAPTTTTFEWSLLQSPSLLKQQYKW